MRGQLTQQGPVLTLGSVDDFVAFESDDMAPAAKIISEGKIHAQ
jgi:hypothetical protein